MEIWKAGPDVMKMLRDLIKKHHPHLLLVEDEIGVVFREKAKEIAGVTILGATRKAPPLLPVLTDKKFTYKYIVELAADAWQTLDDRQRMACLDHHLCSMRVEEDAESGEMKCSIRPPDFIGYKGEVERWGMWRPMDDETLTVIEQMFSDKAESKPQKRSSADDDMDEILDALSGKQPN
jgi:hypothetical protein